MELCLRQSRAGADMDPPPISCWSSAVPTDLPFPSFPEDGFAQGRFQLNPNTALCFQKSRSLQRGKGSRSINCSSPVHDGSGDHLGPFSPSGWSCFYSKPAPWKGNFGSELFPQGFVALNLLKKLKLSVNLNSSLPLG